MAGEQSVAPKNRVNLTYKTVTNGVEEQIELPNVLVALGDFGGVQEGKLKTRKLPEINKRNFDEVLASQRVKVKVGVKDKLTPEAPKDAELGIQLSIERMKDFNPEEIAKQVPELAKLLALRQALLDLKTAFTDGAVEIEKVKAVLKDDAQRAKLMQELGLSK